MSKYIEADKLKAEIKRQKHELEFSIQSQGDYGQSCHIVAYENILSLIDSLQQEQPEVDLEKEIDRVFFQQDCGSDKLYYNEIANIAHHFAEWGAIHLNARKEE